MANDANIRAVITADDKASGVLKSFGDNVGTAASKVGSALKIAAEGLAVGGAAAAAFGLASVKAYSESQDVLAQLNSVLISTKNAAGFTAESAIELSKALQSDTKYSDEAVLSVENLLLTFTSIGKKIMPQATETVLDMATALGEDTKSAAIQLGKALQDPVLGITALRRVGVNFSESQKDVIAKLVETGQKAKAQELILKELNTEFGGSARAAGETFSGSLAHLKNSFNDVQEVIGQTISKSLGPLINKVADFVASVDWSAVIGQAIKDIKTLVYGIEGLVSAFKGEGITSKGFVGSMEEIGVVLRKVYDFVGAVGRQVEQYLQPKFIALWHTVDERLIPTLANLWKQVLLPLIKVLGTAAGEGLVWAVGEVVDILNTLITITSSVMDWMLRHKDIVLVLAGAFGTLAASMAIGAAVDAIKVGFATLQLVTIPGLIAQLGFLAGAFVAALPYAAIGAFVVWFGEKMNGIKNAYDSMNQHISGVSDDAIRIQQQAISDFKAGKITKDQEVKILQIAQAEADSVVKHRASGGPVMAGSPYIVGESGQEMFVPNQSGTIIPNNKMGGSTININVNAGALMGSDVEARKFAQIILGHLKDAAGSKSMTLQQLMGL